MKKILVLLTLAFTFAGCTKENLTEGLIPPPTKDLTVDGSAEEGEVVQKKTIRVDDERVEMVARYFEDGSRLEVSAVHLNSGDLIGTIYYVYNGTEWILINIDSVPCWCIPECSSYSASLCRWWKCVDATINANNSFLVITSVFAPEVAAGALIGIGVGCTLETK